MSCTGSTPTFTSANPTVTHDGSACGNTIHIFVDEACGAHNYTLSIYRVQGASTTFLETVFLPDGPLSAYDTSYVDTPPCGVGNVGYYGVIGCEGSPLTTS